MATNKIVHANQASSWGFFEEGTFGDAGAAADNIVIFDGPVGEVDYGIFQDHSVRNARGMVPSSSDAYTTEKGQTRVISYSDMIVRKAYLADLLYSVIQDVTEAGAGDYEKAFTWNHAFTQPDFSSNAGYFMNVWFNDTIASRDRCIVSCISRELTLSANMAEGDGRLRAAGQFISGFANQVGLTHAGTASHSAQSYYDFNAPQASGMKIDNQDIVCYAWSVTFNNNAKRVGNDGSGHAETYSLGGDNGLRVTGSLSVKYDANSAGAIAAFIAGTNSLVQIAIGTDSSDGNLDLLMTTARHTGPKKDYSGAEGQRIELPFEALGVSGDATGQIDATMSDAILKGW